MECFYPQFPWTGFFLLIVVAFEKFAFWLTKGATKQGKNKLAQVAEHELEKVQSICINKLPNWKGERLTTKNFHSNGSSFFELHAYPSVVAVKHFHSWWFSQNCFMHLTKCPSPKLFQQSNLLRPDFQFLKRSNVWLGPGVMISSFKLICWCTSNIETFQIWKASQVNRQQLLSLIPHNRN